MWISLDAKVQGLQKELGEADQQVVSLSEENKGLRALAAEYRANWINESRRADALELYGPDGAPCMSQAGWLSHSPDRSYSGGVAEE